MAISKRTRFEVLRRDNNTCRYCHATDTPLTIDHVVPTALGGSDDPSNLVAACKDCNAGKSSSSPDAALVEQVSDDAIRWSAAMQAAAERMAANKSAVDEQLQPWFDEWFVRSGPGWSYKLPDDADAVLTKYLAAGMPLAVLIDAARVALRKQGVEGRFRYFQGVANNMLAELQRDAAAILEDGEGSSSVECAGHRDCDCELFAYMRGYDRGRAHQIETSSMFQSYALSRVVDGNVGSWLVAG